MRRTLVLVPLLAVGTDLAAQTPAWRMSEPEVRAIVEHVRAGRSLKPAQWPGGARVAVLLSFDVDNETPTLTTIPDPTQASIGALSKGEYGARVGLGRVLATLDRYRVPATFFIPAMSLKLHPEMADAIKRGGRHEFAVHGWIHEQNPTLPADAEADLVKRAAAELERMTGAKPVGYRAPSWNFSPNTLAMLKEQGFLYDSSLMADESPYELKLDGKATGIVELPVEWILDDAPLFDPRGDRYASPREVLQVYIDEFDRAWEEGTMFVLTMHPHISGHRSRILVLEKLIEHIQSKGGAWFATHRQAAEYVKGATPAKTQ
ncbi:MAG TPA: polysaccharide deacetylase [Longimicrobiales bacterium]|nr:polysaccharide deacetylase [Longimicrobiales bacterium]